MTMLDRIQRNASYLLPAYLVLSVFIIARMAGVEFPAWANALVNGIMAGLTAMLFLRTPKP